LTTLEISLLAALSRRLAGEGELTLQTQTRQDGSQFLTCERIEGFWGVPGNNIDALANAMLDSLCVEKLTQEEIEKLTFNPSERGKRGGSATSDAKRASSAANGKKGGRPKKT